MKHQFFASLRSVSVVLLFAVLTGQPSSSFYGSEPKQTTRATVQPDPTGPSASAIDSIGDPFVNFDPTGPVRLTGIFFANDDPTTWQVSYQPDANEAAIIPIQSQISAGADGTYAMLASIPHGSISANGALITVTSTANPQLSVKISIDSTGTMLSIVSPIGTDPDLPAPTVSNRMRIQLQTGRNNAWSLPISHNRSPVTVAELEAGLDQMYSDYVNRNIANGPSRNTAAMQAFQYAIQSMKTDLNRVPPVGFSQIGNVKRKTFSDGSQTWRIDIENNAGVNATK